MPVLRDGEREGDLVFHNGRGAGQGRGLHSATLNGLQKKGHSPRPVPKVVCGARSAMGRHCGRRGDAPGQKATATIPATYFPSAARTRCEREAVLRGRSARKRVVALAVMPRHGQARPASLMETPFLQVTARGGRAVISETEESRRPRLAGPRSGGRGAAAAVAFFLARAKGHGLKATAATGVVSLKGLRLATAITFVVTVEGRQEAIGRSQTLLPLDRVMTRGQAGNSSRGPPPAPAVALV